MPRCCEIPLKGKRLQSIYKPHSRKQFIVSLALFIRSAYNDFMIEGSRDAVAFHKACVVLGILAASLRDLPLDLSFCW